MNHLESISKETDTLITFIMFIIPATLFIWGLLLICLKEFLIIMFGIDIKEILKKRKKQ